MSGRGAGPAAWLAAVCGALALSLCPTALAQSHMTAQGGQSSQGLGNTACSGHGNTTFNRCFCDPGWVGANCDARETPLDCGDHGKAKYGRCFCEVGWKGKTCSLAAAPKCVHGKPDHDKCFCETGWTGDICDQHA
jgi:hypothetical protein